MRRLISPGKVAKYLAVAGLSNKYQIAKDTGMSYPRVHESIPRLEALGLVKSLNLGRSRTKLPLMGHRLTLEGLATTMYVFSDLWAKIDTIAEANRKLLPLVFGKWKYFEEMGVKAGVIERLKGQFEVIGEVVRFTDSEHRIRPEVDLEAIVNEGVICLMYFWVEESPASEQWKKAVVGDPDLKKLAKETTKRWEEAARRNLKAIKSSRNYLIKKRDGGEIQ